MCARLRWSTGPLVLVEISTHRPNEDTGDAQPSRLWLKPGCAGKRAARDPGGLQPRQSAKAFMAAITILILDPSQRRQIRKLITSPKLAAPRKHVVTSLLHGVQHPTAESRNEHTHQGLLFWAETQHQALILKPLRGEAAREAQRLRARAQCVLTALSYRRTRFRPQPALWKNPVFSGLVCRSALKDHIFDTLWPEHCQQRRSRVLCTSSAVLASAACTSYNWTANSTAVESEKWRIAWGVLPLHWLRYAARGIAIARNWILLATATWHAPTRSCQPRKLPRPAVPTSQFSTTRPQRDMEKSHRADTFSINGNKGPEIPNLGTKGSFRTPSSARENLKFEVGERFKQVLAPVVFQPQASPPPTIGVAPDRDLQAQTQVAGPPASAPENTNRLVIRHAPLVLYPWMRVAHFCHLQKPRRSLVHVNLALRCGVMSVDFCSFADSACEDFFQGSKRINY
ncbi:hypothetical protein V8E51_013241 [Hyaloscypha variabilis]